MLHQLSADVMTAAMQHGEATVWQARFTQSIEDSTGKHFTGAGVCLMRFHHDWAARGQRANRVSADHADGEGKITRTKDDHRTDGLQDAAHIWLRRGYTIWERQVDAHLRPRTLTDQRGEHLALADSATALASETSHGQCRFLMGTLKQGITQRHDFIRQMIEQSGASFCRGHAQRIKSTVSGLQSFICQISRGFTKEGFQLLIRRRIHGLKWRVIGGGFATCDEMMSGEHKSRKEGLKRA
jgi:hypothetical protein